MKYTECQRCGTKIHRGLFCPACLGIDMVESRVFNFYTQEKARRDFLANALEYTSLEAFESAAVARKAPLLAQFCRSLGSLLENLVGRHRADEVWQAGVNAAARRPVAKNP